MEAAWLTPLPWFAELTGGVYQAIGVDDEHPLDFGSTRHDNVPFLGHFKNQFDLNDATTLELGQSVLQGRGSDGLHARRLRRGRDDPQRAAKKLEPARVDPAGRIHPEGLRPPAGPTPRSRTAGTRRFQYRLSQVWWAGIRGEQARDSFTDFLVDDAGDPIPGKVTRGSANIAWTPSEFSFIRLEYSHAKADDGAGIASDGRPDHDPNELHDRLPPGSRVLRAHRLVHRGTREQRKHKTPEDFMKSLIRCMLVATVSACWRPRPRLRT